MTKKTTKGKANQPQSKDAAARQLQRNQPSRTVNARRVGEASTEEASTSSASTARLTLQGPPTLSSGRGLVSRNARREHETSGQTGSGVGRNVAVRNIPEHIFQASATGSQNDQMTGHQGTGLEASTGEASTSSASTARLTLQGPPTLSSGRGGRVSRNARREHETSGQTGSGVGRNVAVRNIPEHIFQASATGSQNDQMTEHQRRGRAETSASGTVPTGGNDSDLDDNDEQDNFEEEEIPEEELPMQEDLARRPANLAEQNRRVEAYFEEFDRVTQTRKCTRCPGDRKIKGNLNHAKSHLSSKHKIIARALGLPTRDRRKRPRPEESDNEEVQPPPKKLKPVNINKTIRELVELFLSGNLSLNIADKLKNVEIIKREFEANHQTFNRRKLKEYILKAAEHTYKEIANEVRGKFPSLMFDSASRHERNVFSASLRFAKGEEIVERTIGVITQHEGQTARNLFHQIEQLLTKVGLTFNDVYSTCTDQGRNMLRAADLTAEAQVAIRICRGLVIQEHEDNNDEDINRILEAEHDEEYQDAQMLREEEEVDREVERQQRLQQVSEEDVQDDAVADIVVEEGNLCTKMVCGAHTCQLAAKGVIKDFQNVIDEVRNVVKISKRLEFTQLLKDAGIKRLHKDNETRWDSVFQMINDVFTFKDQLEGIALNEERLALSEDTWQFVEEFVQAFTPVHFAMKDFQRADITISDFYIRWEKMELQITKVPGGIEQLKENLLAALNRRKKKFFECDAFVAALLLDPRINWSQDPEDFFGPALCERGMKQIEKVHQVITNRRQEHQIQEGQGEPQVQHDEEEDELNQRLGGGRRVQVQVEQNPEQAITIRQKVNRFLAEARLPGGSQLNPQKYWYNKRDEEPEIYRVSQVVYGAAFSQVKVERDFSGFALVLTHLRTLLADDTLNAILVAKNNLDLLRSVKFV